MTMDPNALMACATKARPAMPPICQQMLDRLNKDQLGVHTIACMQSAGQICGLSVMAGGEDMDQALFKCLNENSARLGAGCQDLVKKNFEVAQAGPTGGPDDKEKKGGNPAAIAAAVLFALLSVGLGIGWYRERQANQTTSVAARNDAASDVSLDIVTPRTNTTVEKSDEEYERQSLGKAAGDDGL